MFSIKTVLHPTDFSSPAEPALRLARELARDHRARLVVLHVEEASSGEAHPGASSHAAEDFPETAEARIALLEAEAPGLQVDARLMRGDTVGSILETAAETGCDLIVMGSHGRTGLSRMLMGSVAESVARQASCPTLILRDLKPSVEREPSRATTTTAGAPEHHAPRFSVILLPTDFSERSRAAIEVASSLMREGSRVIFLHVVGAVHIASEGYAEALEERLRAFAVPVAGVQTDYILREGDAAEEILRVVSETVADLIVIPSHGRTGLDRLLMGSVAEQVLRSAPCPVLILKTPGDPHH